MEPVVERPEGDVLEDQLEAEVLVVLTDSHEEEDVGVGDAAEVVQLSLTGSLPDCHLGQVPQLPHHPTLPSRGTHREDHRVTHQLKLQCFSLEMITQGTVWMGLFMAPGLPLVNVIKLILIMYIKVTFMIICSKVS